ncbi:hypothetical protein SAMN02799616_05236 [Paenibacillus sp. UNC499MF]|nr:hypothetical protein SAMN02799616_05236 [Paenibacillus sp. UNC499MF]
MSLLLFGLPALPAGTFGLIVLRSLLVFVWHTAAVYATPGSALLDDAPAGDSVSHESLLPSVGGYQVPDPEVSLVSCRKASKRSFCRRWWR